MSTLQVLVLLLISISCVGSISTTQFVQGLRSYTAEPTALVQFVPFIDTDIPTSIGGVAFANKHITRVSASIPSNGPLWAGNLIMQTVNTGEYSQQITGYGLPFMSTTYMSCSGAMEESVRTCVWTVESSSSRNISQLETDTYTGTDSVVSTNTWTSSGGVWDTLGTSTSTSIVLIRDHIHTIDLDMLVHPKTSNTAATTSESSSLSMPT